jgi:ribosome maturation factor RimP
MSLDSTLKTLIEKATVGAGFEVVDAKVDGRRHIRIWIDREPVGVNVADCATVNRAVKRAFDEEGLDAGAFHVEVQSPGLDRPLTRDKDYTRFGGSAVIVHLAKKRGDRRKFRGRLVGLRGGQVVIVEADTGQELSFTKDEIDETRLVPDVK